MGKRVAVVGVGMTKQRSSRPDVNGQELINEAVRAALEDEVSPGGTSTPWSSATWTTSRASTTWTPGRWTGAGRS
ncbi:MAG: hypothetical protein ACUVRX_08745 [Actinomycetota bacterium]